MRLKRLPDFEVCRSSVPPHLFDRNESGLWAGVTQLVHLSTNAPRTEPAT